MIGNEDITIAFSGYNIKDYVILAIKSFLHFYPHLQGNIVFFDDFSSDGTKEWLEQNRIKRISWKHHRAMVEDYYRKYGNAAFRVNLITQEIMLQSSTRYLLINDGDIAFTGGGFLEEYLDLMRENKALLLETQYMSDFFTQNSQFDVSPTIKQYQKHVSNPGYVQRIWGCHSFYDLPFFKTNNLFYDRIQNDDYNRFLGIKVDSGVDFFYLLKENQINYLDISPLTEKYWVHFTWLSSYMRMIEQPLADKDFIKEQMSTRVLELCKQPLLNQIIGEHDLKLLKYFEIEDELA